MRRNVILLLIRIAEFGVPECKPKEANCNWSRLIFRSPIVKLFLVVVLFSPIAFSGVVLHQYRSSARLVDQKLSGNVLDNPAKVYAAPSGLVTNLSDGSREKRRLLKFHEMPKVLVDAVIAGEDQRFYSHRGLDPVRIGGALVANLKGSGRLQGGSTITQQLARNVFLTPETTWRRKVTEAFIALSLERRLSKEEIFTLYANEVYLGQRGSFGIHGFGEAAAWYFDKEVRCLTLAEAATLAGIIPAPNAYSPTRHPDRAIARRNMVLQAMHRTEAIKKAEFEMASGRQLNVAPPKLDLTDAPYFVDFVREELSKDYSETELMSGGLNVYTTLDPELQKAAVEAVEKGLALVEEQLSARDKNEKNPEKRPRAQAALIVIDPRTGEIKAMVGGSDYTTSQYNRVTRASRQPGSIFKPFVYAAALETAYDAPRAELDDPVITLATLMIDEPTVFADNLNRSYEPSNYNQRYRGPVTVGTGLRLSLNVPTVKVAERIGYNRVATLAKRAGLNEKILAFPSMALGAFEVTLMELAGAYTVFANEGRRIQPHALLRVTAPDGALLKAYTYESQEVLRPEIAYLLTRSMESAIERGTGGGVRAQGFTLPAAGKTGTSRDGWFAGYTKDLLAIAWVGFDDHRDLNLEGARSALPIWVEFMKTAYKLHPASSIRQMHFAPPRGIEIVSIDADSLALASPFCESKFQEAFIAGTAPTEYCTLHWFPALDF